MTPQRIMPFVATGSAAVAVVLAAFAVIRTRGGGEAAAAEQLGDQVTRWTAAWTTTRGCLVGSPPASPAIGEALRARDLVAARLDTCSRQVVDLRGVTPDGPVWVEVQRQVATLADAYTKHRVIATSPQEHDEDTLEQAIGILDVAGTRLRRDAGLAPAEPVTARPMPVLDGVPFLYDGDPVQLADVQPGHIVVRSPDTGEWANVEWFGGTPRIEVGAYLGGSVWSVKGGWKIKTVDRDDHRTMYADPPNKRIAAGSANGIVALAALGEEDTRFALYYDDSAKYLMRSTDAGETWSKTRLPGDYALLYAVAGGGSRLDLAYWDEGVYIVSLTLAGHGQGAIPRGVRISTGEVVAHCDSGALWLVVSEGSDYVLRRATDTTEIARFRTAPQLRACSTEHAVLGLDDVERLCNPTECRIVPTARDAGATFVGEVLIRHSLTNDIIAVWRDFAEPTFVRAPTDRTVRGIIDREGVATVVLGDDDDRVSLATLP